MTDMLSLEVINALLVGLPVKLHDGSISSVTARIPWPNPLTANIGLSIQALHLVFHLDEEVKEVIVQDSANIAESVVSVAESFLHHELSPGEEASLRESFHPDLASSSVSFHDVVPGGLDPFASTDEEAHPDMDPAGVSIFATMIERLLSRFEFDATDTSITLVHPSHSGYTFKVSDIRYGRDPESTASSKPVDASANAQASEMRSISLSGIALSCFDLRPQDSTPEEVIVANTLPDTMPHNDLPDIEIKQEAPRVHPSVSPSSCSPSPSSPSPQPQSDSDMDEDTQLLMSQSITLLPTQSLSAWPEARPPSPASTTASSMFESAITTIQEGSEEVLDGSPEAKQNAEASSSANPSLRDPSPPHSQSTSKPSLVLPEDQHRIISLSSTPILIRVTTSLTGSGETSAPTSSPGTNTASTAHPGQSTQPPRHKDLGQVKVEVTMGVIACALQAWQIRDVTETLDVVQKSISRSRPSAPSPESEGKKASKGSSSPLSMLDQVEARLHCAGIVVLLLPSQGSSGKTMDKMIEPESAFFAHPLVPHKFPCSYVRVLIERIDATASVNTTTSSIKEALKPRDAGRPQRTSASLLSTTKVVAHLTIADLSVCVFNAATPRNDGSVVPFLITDPHLLSQYSFEESHWFGPASPHAHDTTFSAPPSDTPPLPTFDVSDWTDPSNRTTQAKLSTWRTKAPQKSRHVSSSGVRPSFGKSPPLDVPLHINEPLKHGTALSIRAQLFWSAREGQRPGDDPAKENTVDVDIAPLHFFTDLALLDQDAHVDIPFVQVSLTKSTFDGLQFWADDVSQLVERLLAPINDETEGTSSQSPSLIGSKYFAKGSRTGSKDNSMSGTIGGTERTAAAETIVKVIIAEVSLRLILPREEDGKSLPTKPFDVLASNVDLLLELKPEGKDETVLTLSVSDLNILDAGSTLPQPLFSSITSQTMLANSRPIVKLRFTSLMVPESTSKESRINLTLFGFLYNFNPDLRWANDLAQFVKPPPGVFESVIPSERTKVAVKVMESSIRLFSIKHKGALVVHLGDFQFSTDIVGNSPKMVFDLSVHSLAALLNDDHTTIEEAVAPATNPSSQGCLLFWKRMEYALIAEVSGLNLQITQTSDILPNLEVIVDGLALNIHLCADTGAVLGAFLSDFGAAFSKQDGDLEKPPTTSEPTRISEEQDSSNELLASMDEQAFRRMPEVGAAPDLINDDLPSNAEYLDTSFGAAAGLRVLEDEDLDDFDESDVVSDNTTLVAGEAGITSKIGGETIKLLRPEGIHAVENYFDSLPAISEESPQLGETRESIRIVDSQVTLFLYEGYDWLSTRKTIENEIKEMKRRLARIRQLVASGQSYDPSVDETSTLLFNSVYVGLEQDLTELEPNAALAAIDEELREDFDTASQSSWQSLRHQSQPSGRTPSQPTHGSRGQKLTRSKSPSIEFRLMGLNADVDRYVPGEELVSRTFAIVKDMEILDHVKTSTWRKFLSALWADSRGNVRETGSNMVRIELRSVRPVPGNPAEEARLRAKILPLRLHVDQDALDFLKKFFSFQDPNAASSSPSSSNEIYFQQAEVFPVGLKLDYKPRRVDYRALRDGKTIELMNFFHFDGAEMTLRHITVSGVTGWARFFDLLNDLWTPDVKATQLAEIISGVAPIRSIVNVGSGVADLVLLPIAQYRKDGRVVRGVQRGTKAFVKSTAMEAVKLGARLATGTQVILEQAENVLGSQFNESITAEMMPVSPEDEGVMESSQEWGVDRETGDLISKYAEQPTDVKEGIQTAYTSLRRNLNSAAQTILAVPMEVYERSGNEGPVRAVIRAVPIAVLKPMIGASEAVSKALMGIHNSMDPDVRRENETKYKQR
ncbi:hypothetical protein EWM64_g299 [Hericium alpestre]|uniref:Autophagy-related protein 2 n=1 Tax=Hericium alpestre TaxID=135208 RepID=A0A4Z0A9E8_9AGAM|nr:hypothetical protein EWM64_g299 [Hericium alpestre]